MCYFIESLLDQGVPGTVVQSQGDFDDILSKVTLRSRCLVEYVHCVQTKQASTADKALEFEVLGFPCKLSTATFRASPAETTIFTLHTTTTAYNYSFHHIRLILSSKYFIMGGLLSGGSS